MKPKQFNNKLILNKRMIAILNNAEMSSANGGGETVIGCPIPDTSNCTLGQQYTCDCPGSGFMTFVCCD